MRNAATMFTFDPNPTTARKAWSSSTCLLYAPCARGTFFAPISSFSDIITLTKITLRLHSKVTC